VHRVAQYGRDRFRAAPVRHADDIDAGARLEELGGEMRQATDSGMGIVELAGVGLGLIDELLERLGRE
jgi:hypothetical protein